MPYTITDSLPQLGTGLTLKAQLYGTNGAAVGSEITTGIVEIGATGDYLATLTISDDFRGGVRYYTGAAPGTFQGFRAINPQEGEYSDVKASTLLAGASYTAPDNTAIGAIKAQTDKLAFAGSGPYDVKATLDGEQVTLADGSITAAKLAADAINASKVAADVATEIATQVNTTLTASHGAGAWNVSGSGGSLDLDGATIREITITAPGVNLADSLIIAKANDYKRIDNRQVIATQTVDELWPDLTDAAIAVQLTPNGVTPTDITGAVVQATGAAKSIDFEISRTQFTVKAQGVFTIIATLADGNVVTLRSGTLSIR